MFKILSGNLSATFNLDGNHLERYLLRKNLVLKSLCEDLILHEQVLVPTQDYLTACGLFFILGEHNLISLLEADKIRFLRTRGVFGYVRGKERDGAVVTFRDPEAKRPQDSEIDASVQAGLSVIDSRIKNKKLLHELLIQQSTSLELSEIVDSVKLDSYEDLKKTHLWRKKYQFPKEGLLMLPKMEKMGVRVLGAGTDIQKNVVDMLLALTLFNIELYLCASQKCVSSSTASPIGDVIEMKINRLVNQKLRTENFWSLLEINNVPDFGKIKIVDKKHFDDLIKLTNTPKANIFRQWFHDRKNLTEKEIFKEYIEVLRETPWIQRLPSKAIRFVITSGLDLIPVAGKIASFLDQFVVETIIKGKSPKYFVEELKTFAGRIELQ